MQLKISDNSISGQTNNSFFVNVEVEYISVKELIKLRIYQEIEDYNKKMPEYFRSLVQPTNAEITLNGYRLIEKRQLDPEKQYYLALDAFIKNGFFLLINNLQVDSLEQMIKLEKNMELNFIKLTQLVGG
jgi:hypothetical protein